MMERNRKLRLLVTTDCPNHCPLCCNNSWDFSKLPSVTSFDYDEVMITDGIVLTPHSKDDVKRFIRLNERLRMYLAENPQLKSSLRLNLFKNIKDMLPEDIDLSIWKVKDIEWIKDCPVPKGEDFKRLSILWKE